MAEQPLSRVDRHVTTQDVTWLLDQHKNGQLDLDPAYQRKSVWTPKDRRFFMDTIFRNYPAPAIFLHKTIDEATDETTYHVVDGKQRIQTILLYVNNRFGLAGDFGDERFNGKRWRDFADKPEIKRLLWNYRITVEELDDTSVGEINDVFSRLNKNASKLTAQELRHARFDGWFISFVENEVEDAVWRSFKIRTIAKEKRMTDVQNLSELAAVVIRKNVSGFSQLDLDDLYATHDDPAAEEIEFDSDAFVVEFTRVRDTIASLESNGQTGSDYAQPFYNFYVLWAAITRNPLDASQIDEFAANYVRFMAEVADLQIDESDESLPDLSLLNDREADVTLYKLGSIGATTDEPKRRDRLAALESALFQRSRTGTDEDR